MFQIVQGMYFRPVPLTNTTHRQVYYTNLSFQRNVIVDAPFGRLLPSTEFSGIHTLTVEAKEQLETMRLDGTPEVLVATGGDQLLDEIADVVSFCLNAVCVRDLDMARRLVATAPGARFGPSAMLRQTFDADRQVSAEEIADLTSFVATLVGTLMVAALESLGIATTPRQATWEEYDPQKRARIDAAIEEMDATQQDRVRSGVLETRNISSLEKTMAPPLAQAGQLLRQR